MSDTDNSRRRFEESMAKRPIIHNPCQMASANGVCGKESCRIAINGKRYCERCYNQLPKSLKHQTIARNTHNHYQQTKTSSSA